MVCFLLHHLILFCILCNGTVVLLFCDVWCAGVLIQDHCYSLALAQHHSSFKKKKEKEGKKTTSTIENEVKWIFNRNILPLSTYLRVFFLGVPRLCISADGPAEPWDLAATASWNCYMGWQKWSQETASEVQCAVSSEVLPSPSGESNSWSDAKDKSITSPCCERVAELT